MLLSTDCDVVVGTDAGAARACALRHAHLADDIW